MTLRIEERGACVRAATWSGAGSGHEQRRQHVTTEQRNARWLDEGSDVVLVERECGETALWQGFLLTRFGHQGWEVAVGVGA